MMRVPRALLRAEGLALLGGAVALYAEGGYGWLLFAALFFAPDVSFLGYAFGPRAGAAAYDALHTTLAPVALAVTGVVADAELAVRIGLVWLAHIGLDRLLGYGLKYPTAFKDTHLQRV